MLSLGLRVYSVVLPCSILAKVPCNNTTLVGEIHYDVDEMRKYIVYNTIPLRYCFRNIQNCGPVQIAPLFGSSTAINLTIRPGGTINRSSPQGIQSYLYYHPKLSHLQFPPLEHTVQHSVLLSHILLYPGSLLTLVFAPHRSSQPAHSETSSRVFGWKKQYTCTPCIPSNWGEGVGKTREGYGTYGSTSVS